MKTNNPQRVHERKEVAIDINFKHSSISATMRLMEEIKRKLIDATLGNFGDFSKASKIQFMPS